MLAATLAVGFAHAFPAEPEVREMLRQRVEVSKRGVGFVVALVDGTGSRIVAYGHARRGNDELVTGDSVFEIGSVTKVFTSLLLADMAEKGEVKLQDPIALYVPDSVKSPRVRDITLLHLSRHTSGLPSWPDNMRPADPVHYADGYTNALLFDFLNGYKTRRTVGTHHSYSNYGAALLGEVLARRAGTDFESALRSRVFEPLGMESTGFALTPQLRGAHALGHTARGRPIPLGSARGMLGSGALHSSANDLARFLEANLGLRPSSLAAAMRATHSTDADRQLPDLPMGLGWFQVKLGETRATWHNGATIGFRAYVGMDLERKRGVVVLANSDTDVTNLGNHLLEPSIPLYLPDPPREFKRVQVDIRLLDEFVGTYRRNENDTGSLRFHRNGDELTATYGATTLRVFCESETTVFTEDMETWGTFTRDARGRIDGISWNAGAFPIQLQRAKSPEKK
jgi:CubicO group peptidase (beta-lactamase class C family)